MRLRSAATPIAVGAALVLLANALGGLRLPGGGAEARFAAALAAVCGDGTRPDVGDACRRAIISAATRVAADRRAFDGDRAAFDPRRRTDADDAGDAGTGRPFSDDEVGRIRAAASMPWRRPATVVEPPAADDRPNRFLPDCRLSGTPGGASCDADPAFLRSRRPYVRPLKVALSLGAGSSAYRLGLAAAITSVRMAVAPDTPQPDIYVLCGDDPRILIRYLVCRGLVRQDAADGAVRSVATFHATDGNATDLDTLSLVGSASRGGRGGSLHVRRLPPASFLPPPNRAQSHAARYLFDRSNSARLALTALWPELGCDIVWVMDLDSLLLDDPTRDHPAPSHSLAASERIPAVMKSWYLPRYGPSAAALSDLPLPNVGVYAVHACRLRSIGFADAAHRLAALNAAVGGYRAHTQVPLVALLANFTAWHGAEWNAVVAGTPSRPGEAAAAWAGAKALHWVYRDKPWMEGADKGTVIRGSTMASGWAEVWGRFAGQEGSCGAVLQPPEAR
ncbi:hypothetical protein DFJ74DRAFT_701085 [Hyaloraphidium curvatum]|nr:hypothetical protein DFJ74DRAFT_701085 [Hyaloraphidium curvatum]